MAAHINDPDVLIRSVATRGHLGGLAAAVPAAIRLLGALSYDVILLETVVLSDSGNTSVIASFFAGVLSINLMM